MFYYFIKETTSGETVSLIEAAAFL